jgi:peptide/nickel transport system permease protein
MVALVSTGVGLVIGLVSGMLRLIDAFIMRLLDGFMAIPPILLAIALVAITEASIPNVILAISVPEIPRVTRLVRSVVLTLREAVFVEAAVVAGTRLFVMLWRHILPNTLGPLLVQATYVCASAMLTEAILGFLGAGSPPEIPSWGNIMSEGRNYVFVAGWVLFFPGLFLAGTVLAVNLLGDSLRDSLDPHMRRKL